MASESRVGIDVKIALVVASLLIGVCILVGETMVGVGMAFLIIPLLFYCASRVPVRNSLMVLMFLALVLPNPAEGITVGKDWYPPFMAFGAVLLDHLNTFDRSVGLLDVCSFSGMDICLISLGAITWYRKSTGSPIDSAGRVATPQPLIKLAYVSLGATAFTWLYGMVTGGDFKNSLWQLNAVMYCPIVFFLFQYAIRGPADHKALAKVLLAAAVYKSILAFWVWQNIHGPVDPYTHIAARVAFATCHADSILFADATLLLIALLLEREKIKLWAAILLPIYMLGMVANNRRLVWVQVILVLITVYLISKDNPVKRFIRKALKLGSPAILLYIMVGWNANGSIFKPVRTIRSVVDAKSDGSSYWRELENFNLVVQMREGQILGTGYGHPYREFVTMPEVDYTLEHFVPHNSILGLWAFCGLVGYAGLTMLWAGGVYFAMRAYQAAKNGTDRAAALVSFGAVLVWLMMCFGDLGLNLWAGVFTVAPAFAIAGKLAVTTGEWSDKRGKRKLAGAKASA
jgi:hypothetical protein